MKKLTKAGIALGLSFSCALAFTSCEKLADDATETTTSAENATEDMAAIAAITDLAQDVVSTAGFMMKNGNPILPPGVAIDYLDTIFTDGDGILIKIDFGTIESGYSIEDDPTNAVEGGNGALYLGNYTIKASHPYSDPNCVITVEMDDRVLVETGDMRFIIDDGNRAGGPSREITMSRNGAGWKLEYSLSIDATGKGGSSTKKKRKYLSLCVGSFDVVNVDGGQPGVLDDEIQVTGSSNNKNSEDTEYDLNITETLVRVGTPGCSNTFTKGKITLKNKGSKFDVKADFGDGTCDNEITVTLPGGVKKTITME